MVILREEARDLHRASVMGVTSKVKPPDSRSRSQVQLGHQIRDRHVCCSLGAAQTETTREDTMNASGVES